MKILVLSFFERQHSLSGNVCDLLSSADVTVLLCFTCYLQITCLFTVLYYVMQVCSVHYWDMQQDKVYKGSQVNSQIQASTCTITCLSCRYLQPTDTYMCYICLCLPECIHLPECLSLFCWIFVFYHNRCPVYETKIAFSCLTVVIVRYMLTGSVKCPQQMKVQKIYTSLRSLLGHLSLCFYEVVPNLYQHDRIIKSQLKITGESSMAERRVLKIKVVYVHKLSHS